MKKTSKIFSLISIRKFFILISISFSITSCTSILLCGGSTSPNEVVKDLELKFDWRTNLLGALVVEGTVKNNHSQSVNEIKLKAEIIDKSGTVIETKNFQIDYTITSYGGVATFKEHFDSRYFQVGNVEIKIVSAKD